MSNSIIGLLEVRSLLIAAAFLAVTLILLLRRRKAEEPVDDTTESADLEPDVMEIGDFTAMNFGQIVEGDDPNAWHDRQWQESNLADWFRHRSSELANRAAKREKPRVG